MRTSSPLRYPGGKAAMTSLLSGIRLINQLGDHAVAEPFAGGAGASLSLLYLEDTPKSTSTMPIPPFTISGGRW